MWERSFRQNPLSPTYMNYEDHRAILPEDPTQSGWFGLRKEKDPYKRIYYFFKFGNNSKIILNNNMRTEDRERLKNFLDYKRILNKNLFAFSFIPTTLLYGLVKSSLPRKFKLDGLILFVGCYSFCFYGIKNYLESYDSNISSYYYNKYSSIAVDSLNQVEDNRRKYFRPDTSVPYRQSHQEIYDQKSPSDLHDPSIYYGPHPYDDYENVESVIELNKKFLEGTSSYDHEGVENILGDKIDIKRRIRDIPTVEDYRKI